MRTNDSGKTKAVRRVTAFRSVSFKLFAFFFVSIAALVSATGLSSSFVSKRTITEQVSDFSLQTITQAREKIDLVLGQYESLSLQFVSDLSYQQYFNRLNATEAATLERVQTIAEFEKLLTGMVLADKNLYAVTFYDAEGTFVAAGGRRVANAAGEKAWFRQALEQDGRTVWIPAVREGIRGGADEPVFGLARVIRSSTRADVIQAVVLIEVKASAITKQLANLSFGTSLVDGRNNVVLSAEAERIGAPLEGAALAATDGEPVAAPHAYERGGSLVMYDRFAANPDWYLIGAVPTAELTAGTERITRIMWVMVAAAVLLALLVGVLMVRQIGRPLVGLRNLMLEGKSGNLQVRMTLRKRDEIGQVAESFNEMLEQIALLVNRTNRSAEDVATAAAGLTELSRKTAASSREISAATEQIAGGAAALAEQAERGNETIRHIGRQMEETVRVSEEMGRTADEVRAVSERGSAFMNAFMLQSTNTERLTSAMKDKVIVLQESTRSIRGILDVLHKMAKQTNILALNASIEAARAGAAGRGFMVIAEQIRRLADQTNANIAVIGGMTDSVQREIEDTAAMLAQAYDRFNEQSASVRETHQLFARVSGHMDDFAGKLSQAASSIRTLERTQDILSDAMLNVCAVSQQSSAASEQVAGISAGQLEASEALVELAERLERLSASLEQSLRRFRT